MFFIILEKSISTRGKISKCKLILKINYDYQHDKMKLQSVRRTINLKNYRVWEGQSIKKITECEKDNQFKKLQSVRRTINLKNYRVWEGQSI
jgi:type IV secretory pathway VirB3-like protein